MNLEEIRLAQLAIFADRGSDREIMVLRMQGKSRKAVASEVGLSTGRVQQIENRVLAAMCGSGSRRGRTLGWIRPTDESAHFTDDGLMCHGERVVILSPTECPCGNDLPIGATAIGSDLGEVTWLVKCEACRPWHVAGGTRAPVVDGCAACVEAKARWEHYRSTEEVNTRLARERKIREADDEAIRREILARQQRREHLRRVHLASVNLPQIGERRRVAFSDGYCAAEFISTVAEVEARDGHIAIRFDNGVVVRGLDAKDEPGPSLQVDEVA